MIPYWVLFGLFALGALLYKPDVRLRKPLGLLWLAAIVLTAFIGLRYRTGVDWGNYQLTWIAAGSMSFESLVADRGGDPAFYSLLWLLRNAGLEYWSLNLICAAVFVFGLVSFARRLPNPWLGVLIALPYLTIVIAMSGTRQATAIGFVFLGLLAFFQQRPRAFLAWSGLAALFHASAAIVVPLAGLAFARNRFQSVLLVLAAAALAYFVLIARVELYATRYGQGADLQSAGTGYRLAMSALAAWAYLVFVAPNVGIDEHERTLWRNCAIAAFVAVPLLWVVPSTTALDRLLLYLYPFQIFALGFLPYSNTKASPGFVVVGILAYLGAVLFVFLNFAVNAESYLPYRMYWVNQ